MIENRVLAVYPPIQEVKEEHVDFFRGVLEDLSAGVNEGEFDATDAFEKYIDGIGAEEAKHMAEELQNDTDKLLKYAAEFEKSASEKGTTTAMCGALNDSMVGLSQVDQVRFMTQVDGWISAANDCMMDTVTRADGNVSMNPNLHGYIAEQYHVDTFNMNAELAGSQYRAEVLKPQGTTYTKNGVDIVIRDGSGNLSRKYQSKYCMDADKTDSALRKGDYRGQRPLVPADQAEEMERNVNTYIESPDGIKSNTLDYDESTRMRDKVQETQDKTVNNYDWSELNRRELAQKLVREAGIAALIGASLGALIEVLKQVQKKCQGEDVDLSQATKSVGNAALQGGGRGLSISLVASALKICASKGYILKDVTDNNAFAAIAVAIVSAAETGYKIATKQITVVDGLAEIELKACAVLGGYIGAGIGGCLFGALGAWIGSAICPLVGTVIGETVGKFVGEIVGGIAGNYVARELVPHVQEQRAKIIEYSKDRLSEYRRSMENPMPELSLA